MQHFVSATVFTGMALSQANLIFFSVFDFAKQAAELIWVGLVPELGLGWGTSALCWAKDQRV